MVDLLHPRQPKVTARNGSPRGGDKGIPVVVSAPESLQSIAFHKVAEEVARQISIEAMKPELVIMSRAK